MTRLLHISSSPRGRASESLGMAEVFLSSYRETHPAAEIETFDLWDGSLPAFGPAAAAAKMAVFAGQSPAGVQATAREAAKETFHRFNTAEHYLFSAPMWNTGVPYILKQFIDVVSEPGLVFTFDPEQGYTGLLTAQEGGRPLHRGGLGCRSRPADAETARQAVHAEAGQAEGVSDHHHHQNRHHQNHHHPKENSRDHHD